MEVDYLDLAGEGYMGSMQWQLGREMGTIPEFASRTQENQENLCRDGRSIWPVFRTALLPRPAKVLSYQMLPDFRKSSAWWKVRGLRPFVLMVRETCRYTWVWSVSTNRRQRKTDGFGEKPVPMPLCPQILHGMTWYRSRVSAGRGRWLTAWTMARPSCTARTDL